MTALCWLALPFLAGAEAPLPPNAITHLSVERFATNPLLTDASSPTLGGNLNGPSVIRVPDWLPHPLGRYYLYFAHHGGRHIRLAYADQLPGPWQVHEPGTLRLDQATAFRGHLASPDVHVDHEQRRIRMYFHGVTPAGQRSGVATSPDGIHFTASAAVLGEFYFRVFSWQGGHYALAKRGNSGWGQLSRSWTGSEPFEVRGDLLARMRHCAVLRRGQQLVVFYTRVGDAPERIVAATIDLSGDWRTWRESAPREVLRPELEYEGTGWPIAPSEPGAAVRVQQLRDPCLFEDEGRTFLFYSVAGEQGFAGAEVHLELRDPA